MFMTTKYTIIFNSDLEWICLSVWSQLLTMRNVGLNDTFVG